MPYAERRDGKLTGRHISEFRGKFPKRAFLMKRDAEDYEAFVKLMGREPPTITGDNDADTTGRTFADVAEECIKSGGPEGKWRAERDKSVVPRVRYCASVIGDVDIGNVKPNVLQRIVASLQKRPGQTKKLTNATINRYLFAATAVLTFAVDREYITHKPKTKSLKLPERSKARAILTSYEQEATLLSCIRGWGMEDEAFMIEILLAGGTRRGETYKIRPDQIENGTLTFDEEQTKTDEPRVVWIGEERARKLRAMIVAGTVPKAWRLLRVLHRAAKECGYPSNLVLHSLRHTRNTRLRKEGVDIKIRMAMLGHKSVTTSMRYDHIDIDDQLEAAKKVEEARGELRQDSEVVPFPVSKTA